MSERLTLTIDDVRAGIGNELVVSDWVEIDQARIAAFAEVTGDHQWIHLDVERARRESPYKTTIAHGFLVLSLIPMLSQQSYGISGVRMGINYGLNRVRFMSPVPAGGRVRARFTPKSVEPIDGGSQLVWTVTLELEGRDKPACIAETVSRCLF